MRKMLFLLGICGISTTTFAGTNRPMIWDEALGHNQGEYHDKYVAETKDNLEKNWSENRDIYAGAIGGVIGSKGGPVGAAIGGAVGAYLGREKPAAENKGSSSSGASEKSTARDFCKKCG